MRLTCANCNHSVDLRPEALNPDGSYYGRCPRCGSRLIKHPEIKKEEKKLKPIAINQYPSFMSSKAAYEEWRKEIHETIKSLKFNMYGSDESDIVSPGPPKLTFREFIIVPYGAWGIYGYKLSFKEPPFLLKSHRLFLESRLGALNQYRDSCPAEILAMLQDDLAAIMTTLGWIEKARVKLREKFPNFPLEHEKIPTHRKFDDLVTVSCLLITVIIVSLPSTFGRWGLSAIYFNKIVNFISFVPEVICWPFFQLITGWREKLLISAIFYLSLGWMIYRFYFPTVKMMYPQTRRYFDFNNLKWCYLGLMLYIITIIVAYANPRWLYDMAFPQLYLVSPVIFGESLGRIAYGFRKTPPKTGSH